MANSQSPTPPRVSFWKLPSRSLTFGRLPLVMGVVNVTPDSFSDGGQFLDAAAAVEHGLRLVEEGADILDLGGESTRPYAPPVDTAEELRRVLPVVAELAERTDVPLSIDTSKASVAYEAISAGAQIINDVTGLSGDPSMLEVARETSAAVCLMHMKGTPGSMQEDPTYDDVTGEVFDFLAGRRDRLEAAGIDRQRIALDPGIGFGKTTEHNLTLLREIDRFHSLGCPLLVGHSRKRFIGQVLEDEAADRTAGTLGVALALAQRGVQIVRVHDVAAVKGAITLFDAAGGMGEEGIGYRVEG